MLHRPEVTRSLARFIINICWEDIPEGVRHESKRALINYFAVALAGCRTEPVELALQSLREFGREQATVVGRRERVDALSAAFLNAASANVFDFCDTHLPTIIHPTSPLSPSLFAFAELNPLSGRELLLAFVLGYEVECRIGRVMSPGHYTRGWHITSTCGIFASAAGVGKLLNLSEEQMVWAIGNASTQSSGLCECLGWPAKSLSVGNAARNGMWSALLAKRGFAGPPEPLSGIQGFYNAMGEPPNWAVLTEGLGADWELSQNSIKPYPCGFVIHPFLDAVLDWRREHPEEEAQRIVLRGNPLLSDRTDRPHVATGREAQVSVQHAVAAALVSGEAGVRQFTDAAANDPRVTDLRSRVEVMRDANISNIAAEVDIWTTAGKKHTLSVPAARGSSSNPMSDKDIEDKLRTVAADWDPGHPVQPLIDKVWSLDRAADASELLALVIPSGGTK